MSPFYLYVHIVWIVHSEYNLVECEMRKKRLDREEEEAEERRRGRRRVGRGGYCNVEGEGEVLLVEYECIYLR